MTLSQFLHLGKWEPDAICKCGHSIKDHAYPCVTATPQYINTCINCPNGIDTACKEFRLKK
jgi:hypothetical protein